MDKKDKGLFPHIKQSVSAFLEDQEGNIPRNKVLTIGSMMLILGLMMADDAFAAHRSHTSHTSHRSHSSGSGSHSSHESHQSHTSHESGSGHSSHGSSAHSNHGSSVHSNATPAPHNSHSNAAPTPHNSHSNVAPTLDELNAIRTPAPENMLDLSGKLGLIAINQTPPDTTPVAGTMSETQ